MGVDTKILRKQWRLDFPIATGMEEAPRFVEKFGAGAEGRQGGCRAEIGIDLTSRHAYFSRTRSMYSPVRVSTLIISPVSMKIGT